MTAAVIGRLGNLHVNVATVSRFHLGGKVGAVLGGRRRNPNVSLWLNCVIFILTSLGIVELSVPAAC